MQHPFGGSLFLPPLGRQWPGTLCSTRNVKRFSSPWVVYTSQFHAEHALHIRYFCA